MERSVRGAHLLRDLLSRRDDAGVHLVSEGEIKEATSCLTEHGCLAKLEKHRLQEKNGRAVARLSRHYLATQQSLLDYLATIVVVVVGLVFFLLQLRATTQCSSKHFGTNFFHRGGQKPKISLA